MGFNIQGDLTLLNSQPISMSPIFLQSSDSSLIKMTKYNLHEMSSQEFEIRFNRNVFQYLKQMKEAILVAIAIITINGVYLYYNRTKDFFDLPDLYIDIFPFFIFMIILEVYLLFKVFHFETKFLIIINPSSMKVITPDSEFQFIPGHELHLIKNFDDDVSIYLVKTDEIKLFLHQDWNYEKRPDIIGVAQTIAELLGIEFIHEVHDIENYKETHPIFFNEYYEKIYREENERAEFNHTNRGVTFLIIIFFFFFVSLVFLPSILDRSLFQYLIILFLVSIILYYLFDKVYEKSETVRSLIYKIQDSLIFRNMKFGDKKR